jgi:hypothetical protein
VSAIWGSTRAMLELLMSLLSDPCSSRLPGRSVQQQLDRFMRRARSRRRLLDAAFVIDAIYNTVISGRRGKARHQRSAVAACVRCSLGMRIGSIECLPLRMHPSQRPSAQASPQLPTPSKAKAGLDLYLAVQLAWVARPPIHCPSAAPPAQRIL